MAENRNRTSPRGEVDVRQGSGLTRRLPPDVLPMIRGRYSSIDPGLARCYEDHWIDSRVTTSERRRGRRDHLPTDHLIAAHHCFDFARLDLQS